MEKQIGFIGCGKMAQAIIGGILKSDLVNPQQVMASANTEATLSQAEANFGILVSTDNREVVAFSDLVIVAVKPDLYQEVLEEVEDLINETKIIISIAGGITIDFMENAVQKPIKVVRTMPNTPSLVGEGMTAICKNEHLTNEELETVITLLNSFGKTEIIEEKLMNAVPAISGSSPAYVYMFIEALADGGVLQGFPRDKAYKFASQAVLGAAKMVLETGEHPGKLKDNVCTPGGSTIEAVAELERGQIRSTVINAMESCTKKSKDLTKK